MSFATFYWWFLIVMSVGSAVAELGIVMLRTFWPYNEPAPKRESTWRYALRAVSGLAQAFCIAHYLAPR